MAARPRRGECIASVERVGEGAWRTLVDPGQCLSTITLNEGGDTLVACTTGIIRLGRGGKIDE